MKTVCFFGIYDPAYSRNRVLMRGFAGIGWRILECRADPRAYPGWRKYRELYRQYRRIRRQRRDLVLVAFPGHLVVPLARLLFGRRIVFDAFLSLYDSNVNDRKVHSPRSVRAFLDWASDWSSARLAGVVLLDTHAHIEYFVRTFGVRREKCLRVFVGTDDRVFAPRAVQPREDIVHFHGAFIPLQGIGHILEAAHLLRGEPIRFNLIGRGQEYPAMRRRAEQLELANVRFIDPVPYERLPEHIACARICLGIFGGGEKAARVIPNKVYECLALGKPVITCDSPAVRELERYGALPLVLVPPADPAALAAAVRALCADAPRRERLGRDARALSERHLSPKTLVAELVAELPSGVWRGPGVQVYS